MEEEMLIGWVGGTWGGPVTWKLDTVLLGSSIISLCILHTSTFSANKIDDIDQVCLLCPDYFLHPLYKYRTCERE